MSNYLENEIKLNKSKIKGHDMKLVSGLLIIIRYKIALLLSLKNYTLGKT